MRDTNYKLAATYQRCIEWEVLGNPSLNQCKRETQMECIRCNQPVCWKHQYDHYHRTGHIIERESA